MGRYQLSDKEKVDKILEATGISRSELARRLEVSYKTVYRWLDKGIVPHPSQSRDIDQLFMEYVDLRGVVLQLRKKAKDPIRILKTDKNITTPKTTTLPTTNNAIPLGLCINDISVVVGISSPVTGIVISSSPGSPGSSITIVSSFSPGLGQSSTINVAVLTSSSNVSS